MALVLWLMDDDALDVTYDGAVVVSFPNLSAPMSVHVLPEVSLYTPQDYVRIVKFNTTEEGIFTEVLKGDTDLDEKSALESLSLQDVGHVDAVEFKAMVKSRFTQTLDEYSDTLDAALLPLLNNHKWQECDVTPFWSCSGHLDTEGVKNGYIALSGDLSTLYEISKRFTDQFDEVDVIFLSQPAEPKHVIFHPVLKLKWEVKTQACIDNAIQKLTQALESGLFNAQGPSDAAES